MLPRLRRFLDVKPGEGLPVLLTFLYIAIVAVVLMVSASVFAVVTVRRSFPQVDGEENVVGLRNQVEVIRDSHGIPQIYADNPTDLFFAQGYITPTDRLYQIDLWRREGTGRLAEVLGPSAIGRDTLARAEWTSPGGDKPHANIRDCPSP